MATPKEKYEERRAVKRAARHGQSSPPAESVSERRLSQSYTKRGPGRVHVNGPGKKTYTLFDDDLDAEKWHLNGFSLRERKRRNERDSR